MDSLVEIEMAAFATDRLTRRSFRALIGSPSAMLLVADIGSRVAGYALVLTRRGGRTARLYSIAVAADQAGRGLGAWLLTAAEGAAAERGAGRLSLEVRSDNVAARRLYERRGYAPAGTIESYYADGAAALLYRRELGASTIDRAA